MATHCEGHNFVKGGALIGVEARRQVCMGLKILGQGWISQPAPGRSYFGV